MKVQYEAFAVDEQLHCLWHTDIRELNLQFLRDLDPSYFEKIGEILKPHLSDKENSRHAALAVRTVFSQAVETLFAFIFAAVQAPHIPLGWLLRYSPGHLPKLVRKFESGQQFPTALNVKMGSWHQLSCLFNPFAHQDNERVASLKQGFADFWALLAHEFLGEAATREYNSLKHGLRVRQGGFWAAFGAHLLGEGDFGSSFLVPKAIGASKSSFRVERCFRNWEPHGMCSALSPLACSINNIISFLRLFRGEDKDSVQFKIPEHEDEFKAPWAVPKAHGTLQFSELRIEDEMIPRLSRDDLVELYKKRHVVFEVISPNELRVAPNATPAPDS